MDLEATKLEVIEMLLNTREEAVLKKVKQLLEEDEKKSGFVLTDQHIKILDEERRKHFAGESESYTLEEVMENVNETIRNVRAKNKKKSAS